MDPLLKFDPTLGKGLSTNRKRMLGDATLLRIAPCATLEEVTELAADVQYESARNEQTKLVDIVMAALRYLGQEEVEEVDPPMEQQTLHQEGSKSQDDNQPQRKKQKTSFSTEASSLNEEFVRQVTKEFERRGYVFGLNLRVKEDNHANLPPDHHTPR
ncbi:hypothetical protein ACHAXN_009224 [Cyclotella atomus]